MPRAGVVGYPVAHSLSPMVHGHWLDLFGLPGSYVAHPIAPEDFTSEMTSLLGDQGWVGMNVTIPHKEAAHAFVDRRDSAATRLGAVNTILAHPTGEIEGRNTDLYGFRANLEASPAWGGIGRQRAVILGAGGAARAVVAALQDWGFDSMVIANRSRARAEALAEDLEVSNVTIVDPGMAATALDGADLLVNTTSLGMTGQPPLDLAIDALPMTALVTDIVYKPLETDLLRRARLRGNPVVDGLGMLLHQAVPGFQAWFQPKDVPPVDNTLREKVLRALEPAS